MLLMGCGIQALTFVQCSVNTPQEQSTCTGTGNTHDVVNQQESYATLCTLLFQSGTTQQNRYRMTKELSLTKCTKLTYVVRT